MKKQENAIAVEAAEPAGATQGSGVAQESRPQEIRAQESRATGLPTALASLEDHLPAHVLRNALAIRGLVARASKPGGPQEAVGHPADATDLLSQDRTVTAERAAEIARRMGAN